MNEKPQLWLTESRKEILPKIEWRNWQKKHYLDRALVISSFLMDWSALKTFKNIIFHDTLANCSFSAESTVRSWHFKNTRNYSTYCSSLTGWLSLKSVSCYSTCMNFLPTFTKKKNQNNILWQFFTIFQITSLYFYERKKHKMYKIVWGKGRSPENI